MATENKMTYVKALDYVLTNCTDLPTEIAEKLTALRDAQNKRNTAERKPTEKEQEITDLREALYNLLASAGKGLTVSEIMALDPVFGEMSNQRVASLMRGLLTAKRVERYEEKRKAYFKVA